MLILNFIISMIAILIIFTILISITKSILYLFTQYNYKNYYLFLPIFLTMGSWSLIFIIWYFIATYTLKINLIDIIISLILKTYILSTNIITLTVICIFFGIILHSLCIYLVNIDYKKITGNTRFFIKRIFKVNQKSENSITIKDDPEKISFLTSIIIAIISLFILVFSIVFLLYIGKLLSNKFTVNIQHT